MSILLLFSYLFILILIGLYFHLERRRFTIIPLYTYLSVLTVYLHTITDLNFTTEFFGLKFLISSTAYFPVLITMILATYLFDGMKAAKNALGIILFFSFLHIITLYFFGVITYDTSILKLGLQELYYYFWSILALIIDIFILVIVWEHLTKLKISNNFLKTFITLTFILFVDAFVFVTGVFFGTELYFPILKADFFTRFFVSIFVSLIFYKYLLFSEYEEEKRDKPEKMIDIFSLKGLAQRQIEELKNNLDKQLSLEKDLREAQEVNELVISGSSAGIWDWDILTNNEKWSAKFYELLGYDDKEIVSSHSKFLEILHKEDFKLVESSIEKHFELNKPYQIEIRLKIKNGDYKWFLTSGKAKFDKNGKPVRMVGSIIDVDDRKQFQIKLERMNKLMVDRELEMVKLKQDLNTTEKSK